MNEELTPKLLLCARALAWMTMNENSEPVSR